MMLYELPVFEFTASAPKDRMQELVAAGVAGWDAALASIEGGTFDPYYSML